MSNIVLRTNEPGGTVTARPSSQEQECLGCATVRDVMIVTLSKHPGHELPVCGQCLVSALAVRLAAVGLGAE